MKEAKIDATLYLLTILIQKISKEQPKLLDEMLEGVSADQAGLPKNIPNKEHIDAVFEESSRILKQIKGLGSVAS
ncbi:hypothetical protein J8L98_24605 [Pseudoalteromonas sp. MMG013]|uniref:hypothetical protein n=1 Tax=Pseudoalteromonas sp. MMG013 TaxID=2822687 RepID=UPI001B389EAF|nr:hypothetical protein [Pseudoalteromonas sp. MMG013]MBQ4864865.1 hypothetical protein [Pseudoalteromonas sp. MMG013]